MEEYPFGLSPGMMFRLECVNHPPEEALKLTKEFGREFFKQLYVYPSMVEDMNKSRKICDEYIKECTLKAAEKSFKRYRPLIEK